jgi:hypothetical protein
MLTIELHLQTRSLQIHSFTGLKKRMRNIRVGNIGIRTALSPKHIVAVSCERTII